MISQMKDRKILQIVPKLPGSGDGVGTYASNLADELLAKHGAVSQFITGNDLGRVSDGPCDNVLLHYVNYGYQGRGVPLQLSRALRRLREHATGRVVTIFHELYASAPPWRSAFWLKPFQCGIARSIARLSDACVLTNPVALAQLSRLVPSVSACLQPVPSNFGEPVLTPAQIEAKDPHRWVICGGTALVEKSIRSFRRILSRIPEHCLPREIFVLGGSENRAIRTILKDLPDVKSSYHPQVEASVASEILSRCSLGWLDYFHHPASPVEALFKSSVFAALCAHGVATVLPHKTRPLVFEGETLPGPFFVDHSAAQLPSQDEPAGVGSRLYEWYHRRASIEQLARLIGQALDFEDRPALSP